jgi:hypothetical protein
MLVRILGGMGKKAYVSHTGVKINGLHGIGQGNSSSGTGIAVGGTAFPEKVLKRK